jgi:hypothetical protein
VLVEESELDYAALIERRQPMTPDPLDYHDVEEMHAELRDHLMATDLMASDPDTARDAVANLFGLIRFASESTQQIAMALRWKPANAESAADGLDALAVALDELAFGNQP